MVKIEEYEGRWLVPLMEQAQRNLGTHGRIRTIVIDRGYLDGEDLWQVQKLGVLFVVVGKANMAVTQDAQALAKRERVQVRERVVRHGHGKTATQERLRTELVGIEGLTTYDAYGDPEQTRVTLIGATTKANPATPSSYEASIIGCRPPMARST